MTLYKVVGTCKNNKVKYAVVPYSLFGSLKSMKLMSFIDFLDRCYLTNRKAIKVSNFLNTHKDIEH